MPSDHQQPASLRGIDLACTRDDLDLFRHVDLQVGPGEVLLVEGPNGCGKTSLLHILAGIRAPDSGEVLWDGTPFAQARPTCYAQIAYVGHADGVKATLTAEENLRFAASLGAPGGMDVETALSWVGLGEHVQTMTRHLSAGQRRRLALARLLVTDTRLWILDEPFSALDRAGFARFEQLVARHARDGGAVVMTAHHDVNLPGAAVTRLELGR